jgi:hypothetical protein
MRFIDKIKKMSDLEEKCAFARHKDFIKEEIEKVAKIGGKLFCYSDNNPHTMSSQILERLVKSFENDGFEVIAWRNFQHNIYSFTISWDD